MQSQCRKWKALSPINTVSRLVMSLLSAVVLLACQATSASGASLIQTVSGVLHAENFTYYKLSGEGWLRLELHSLEGDVDLYVSGLTLHPSFFEYELKSDSCGVDVVDIHSSMSRPVGIGLYAHPFYLQSTFRLDIQVVMEAEVDDYEQLFHALNYYTFDNGDENLRDSSKSRSDKSSGLVDDSQEEEEESIWWTIIVTLLKFVLEIIL